MRRSKNIIIRIIRYLLIILNAFIKTCWLCRRQTSLWFEKRKRSINLTSNILNNICNIIVQSKMQIETQVMPCSTEGVKKSWIRLLLL